MNRFRYRRAVIAAAAAGLLASISAFAGTMQGQRVVIVDSERFANGDLGFVHNSSDPVEYIGCQLGGGFGYCYAQNTAGNFRNCFTFDPAMIGTLRSLKSDSYLIFYWNDSGICTTIEVYNESSSSPKKPR